MKRNLRKKLCAAAFFCAFACGISAAPVLAAITVSGVVKTVSSSGDEDIVREATIRLFDKQDKQIAQTTSDEVDGSFTIMVEADELPDVYFLTTKGDFVDTYSQGYHFVVNENDLELPLLPLNETQKVINSVDEPVQENKGIIAGVVEILYDGDYTPLAGVRVEATDGFGKPIDCIELYLNEDQDWDPTLEQTSETGVFALYNIAMPEAPPQNVVLTLKGADPKYFFVVTGAKVFPYKESPESITVAYVIGWEPGAGEDTPIDDGGGGGGGCFVSGVLP